MLLRPEKCYIFKNIYWFLCLKVTFDTLGSFWLKNSSDFGKVQFCPELSNFSWFYPILATGEDFSTIVRLLYKPCFISIDRSLAPFRFFFLIFSLTMYKFLNMKSKVIFKIIYKLSSYQLIRLFVLFLT